MTLHSGLYTFFLYIFAFCFYFCLMGGDIEQRTDIDAMVVDCIRHWGT